MWWIAQSFAEMNVQTTIPEHHIMGEPVVVDILLLNSGDTPISIPDLKNNRWLIEFEVEYQQNTQRIRSSVPEKFETSPLREKVDGVERLSPQITLTPRQVEEIRLQIPNSQSWKTGTHNLTIRFPLNTDQTITQSINIHDSTISYVDLDALSNDIYLSDEDVVWTKRFKDSFGVFSGLKSPTWVGSISSSIAYTSIHLGDSQHIYWISNNQVRSRFQIGERFEREKVLSIPWTNFEVLGRAVTDGMGLLNVPIWVPNPDGSGTLYNAQMDKRQQPTFRKVFVGQKPKSCDTALNQANTPVLLLQLDAALYVLSLTTVGESRIDRLPPKSTKISLPKDALQFTSARFIIDQNKGLQILSMVESTSNWVVQTHSTQGHHKSSTILLEKTDKINRLSAVSWSGSEPIWVTQNNTGEYVLYQTQNTPVPLPSKDVPTLSVHNGKPTIWYLDGTLKQWNPRKK